MPWPTKGLRRASVNSFGIGGSNAHVVLDDALNCLREIHLVGNDITTEDPAIRTGEIKEAMSTRIKLNECKLLTFSAKDRMAIKRLSIAYRDHFRRLAISTVKFQSYFKDLVFTLNSRRTMLPYRGYLVADSLADLQDVESIISTASTALPNPKLGMVFTGQGAVWTGMGKELLGYPVFKDRVMNLESQLKEIVSDWSLLGNLLEVSIPDSKLIYSRYHLEPGCKMRHSQSYHSANSKYGIANCTD